MIKRFINKIYDFFFDKVVPVFGQLFVWRNKYCNVIYYHEIVDDIGVSYMYINADKFKEQMISLKKQGFEFLRFDDFSDERMTHYKKKRILVSFDDGWRSNYTRIFEFMRENQIKYNVFLSVGRIGEDDDYLTWEMVKEMHESGLVGFGAHTYTHCEMHDINSIDWDLEVTKADDIFNSKLGFYPKDFCYPFGYYSKASNKLIVEKSGYQRIYISKSCFSRKRQDTIIFGRTGIRGEDGNGQFLKSAFGYYNIKDFFVRSLYSPMLSIYHLMCPRTKNNG